jgi:hypothetical protein
MSQVLVRKIKMHSLRLIKSCRCMTIPQIVLQKCNFTDAYKVKTEALKIKFLSAVSVLGHVKENCRKTR